MPTASDLVTDLPADFEVFGQAVATSMADLLGGTTGQVLSKASNTDMDFTWVAQDDSNAIQNSIVDAKGDLIAATANDTPARLAVGTNGQVLQADSTAATGLKWATPAVSASGLNLITPTSIANSGGSASLTGALTSASAVTSVSVNGVFTSTYTNYMVVVYEVTTGNSQAVNMRLRASGTDTSGTSYKYGQSYTLYTGTAGAGGSNGGSSFDVTGSTATGDNSAIVYMTNPQAAKNTSFFANAVRYDAAGFQAGRLENTTQYDGFTLFVGGSNVTLKVLVYGIAN